MENKTNLSYGTDAQQKYDVYFPETPNKAAVIVVHGGGWWQGDMGKESKVPERLAAEGYLVFVPNYRLAQGIDAEGKRLSAKGRDREENLFPTQAMDLTTFVSHIRASSDYSFETLGAFGSSSGGNLVTELAVREGLPAVSWSGLVDFDAFYAHNVTTKVKKKMIKADTASADIDQDGSDDPYYKWCLMNLVGGEVSKIHEASPLSRVTKTTGPMYLAVSMNELVHTYEVKHLTKILLKNDVEVRTQYLAGTRHAEAYYDDAIEPSLAFLKHYLLDLPAKK